jgi:hypothetical protein
MVARTVEDLQCVSWSPVDDEIPDQVHRKPSAASPEPQTVELGTTESGFLLLEQMTAEPDCIVEVAPVPLRPMGHGICLEDSSPLRTQPPDRLGNYTRHFVEAFVEKRARLCLQTFEVHAEERCQIRAVDR